MRWVGDLHRSGLALMLLAGAAGESRAQDWSLRKQEQGIEVYTRDVPGSGLAEFRAVTHVKSSLRALVELMLDVERHPEWVENCTEARALERKGIEAGRAYAVTGLPWPVSDRDAVVRWQLSQGEDGTITIAFVAEPDSLPPRKGRVRVPYSTGMYRLAPQPDGTVQVVYQLHAEPGGRLPGWLARFWVVASPFHTLRNLRAFLQTQAYTGSGEEFRQIREPSP